MLGYDRKVLTKNEDKEIESRRYRREIMNASMGLKIALKSKTLILETSRPDQTSLLNVMLFLDLSIRAD